MKKRKHILYAIILLTIFLFSFTNYAVDTDVNSESYYTTGDGKGKEALGWTWVDSIKGARITIWNSDTKELLGQQDFSNQPRSALMDVGWISDYNKIDITEMITTLDVYYYTNDPDIPKLMGYGDKVYDTPMTFPEMYAYQGQDANARNQAIKDYFGNWSVIKKLIENMGIDPTIIETLLNNKQLAILVEPTTCVMTSNRKYIMTCAEAGMIGLNTSLSGTNKIFSVGKYCSTLYQALPFGTAITGTSKMIAEPYTGTNHICQTTTDFYNMIRNLGAVEITAFDSVVVPPEMGAVGFEKYSTNTEVITSVMIYAPMGFPRNNYYAGWWEDEDAKNGCRSGRLCEVKYTIKNDKNGSTIKTGTHKIAIPQDGEAVSWIKWKTPNSPCSATMEITCTSGGYISDIYGGNQRATTFTKKITITKPEYGTNPPDPKATDRNDSFNPSRIGHGDYDWDVGYINDGEWYTYNYKWQEDWHWACTRCRDEISEEEMEDEDFETPECSICSRCASGVDHEYCDLCQLKKMDWGWVEWTPIQHRCMMDIEIQELRKGEMTPNTTGSDYITKSGYGVNNYVEVWLKYFDDTTGIFNERDVSMASDALVQPQIMETYFPEFDYSSYERVSRCTRRSNYSIFEFKSNEYSQYGDKVHYTPIWYPDGTYKVATLISQAWCPSGQMFIGNTDSTIQIKGNLYDDWHIKQGEKRD